MFFVFVVFGAPQALQSPGITAISLIGFRYHNYLAVKLQKEHPDWPDEKLFGNTRHWVIAALQVRSYCC